MALFSRLKSKSKKASKEEEKKAAADAKAAAQPKAPQRGRNGKIISPATTVPEKAINDIPAPSKLPRHFHSPLAPGHGRTYSFEEHSHTETGKPSYFDPQLSSDSGYASPRAESPVHSRDPSTQQPQRDQDYLPSSNKSMPELTLGEEIAQEPAFAEQAARGRQHQFSGKALKPSKSLQKMREELRPDQLGPLHAPQTNQHSHQNARQQRMIQQSMPMRPSSVPAQALQPRHQRVSRPTPQRSSSPGPVLQSAHPALSPRSRASEPPNAGSPFDWHSPSARDHQFHSSSFQPRSPTSPSAQIANSSCDQDEFSPSLNILSGLKVNKRGLILDEEGDPIGELFEGDIIDCVRQKADANGGVLDEYGRIVGRVRTLSIRSTGTSLHRSNTNASNMDHRRSASPAPPVPALNSTREPQGFVEGQHNALQSLVRSSSHSVAPREAPSSPTRLSSTSPQHNSHEDADSLAMRPHDVHDTEVSQQNLSQLAEQHEHSAPRHRAHESSTRRSESLPSVPESRSTAEVVLSDSGSATSDESHRGMTGDATQLTPGGVASQEQVSARQGNVGGLEHATLQQPQVSTDPNNMEHSMSDAREREQPAQVYIPPTISRSVSERALSTAGLPPIPAMPKNYMEFNKAAHAQPIGQYAAPNRGKAPLPAFPSRGLSVGLAGGAFGNGPMPGMPSRRLTTHGFPTSPALNMSGLNAQSQFAKSRTSTPFVRSPLSSHGKSSDLLSSSHL